MWKTDGTFEETTDTLLSGVCGVRHIERSRRSIDDLERQVVNKIVYRVIQSNKVHFIENRYNRKLEI